MSNVRTDVVGGHVVFFDRERFMTGSTPAKYVARDVEGFRAMAEDLGNEASEWEPRRSAKGN